MRAATAGARWAPGSNFHHAERDPATLVARSGAMRAVVTALDAVAKFDTTVLLLGETGVGKELAAKRLHASSRRGGAAFIPVDCTALTDSLIDSQLFGHVKGAFTGAERESLGFARAADGGTLFLDEIGELSLSAQAKLLRLLQERTVTPLGSASPVPVNIRVVAATHRDLRRLVAEGKFREDLFYRLSVVRIEVPPLRERPDDVEHIARDLLERLAGFHEMPGKVLSPCALRRLAAHAWPGNVRELANAVEHAFVFSPGGEIRAEHLPGHLPPTPGCGANDDAPAAPEIEAGEWLAPDQPVVPLHVAERALIARALQHSGGRQSRAAEMLQIERRRLSRKIKALGLESMTRSAPSE